MIEWLDLHEHEKNPNLISKVTLEHASYVIKNDDDFYQAKEDYLLGLGMIREKFCQSELKKKCESEFLSFHTKEEFEKFKKEHNYDELDISKKYHMTFSQAYLDKEPKNIKLYKYKT